MIRSDIFTAVKNAMPNTIKHVALWNHNVEFIDMESAWERPAVFVEFAEMEMTAIKDRLYRARGTMRLHIVTDYDIYDETEIFGLTDSVASAVDGLHGEGFGVSHITSILTNHNHEDLVEEIVSFSFSAEYDVD